MKSILICLSPFLCSLSSGAQELPGIKVNPNKLAYSDSLIQLARQFISGQHQLFRQLPSGPQLYAKPQALAHMIHFRRPPSDKLLLALKAGISIDSLAKLYPGEKIVRNSIVVLNRRISGNQPLHEYQVLQFDGYKTYSVLLAASRHTTVVNKWIWNPDNYSDEFTAIFCLAEPAAIPLPEDYCRMIRYQQFMIDTANVYTADSWKNNKEFTDDYNEETERFMQYAKSRTTDTDSNFLFLLNNAISANLKQAKYDQDFEQYVARYASKEILLQIMRNRMESRGCINDLEDWKHTLNIARLAMETSQRDIFVKAHLYALMECISWTSTEFRSQKMSMVTELQATGLDLASILAGMTLLIDEEDKVVYGRRANSGRILQELPDQGAALQFLLNLISDQQLDYLNRTAFLKMFFEYNFYEPDSGKRKENYYKVRKLAGSWPVGLLASVDWERYKPA